MSATLEGLTAADVLAMMSPAERTAFAAELERQAVKDKSYLDSPMGREVGRYLASKRKELADTSVRGWESCLDKFARAFAGLSLAELENPHGADLIEPWMDARWGKSEPGTYNVNHAIIKDFFRWQVRRGRMVSNPMDLVSRARKKQVYREVSPEDECRALIASAAELRDRIALRLVVYHGLRKSALRAIQFKHFDYQRKRLTIFTKGSKVKPVPIPEAAFWTDLERFVLEVGAEPDHFLMCPVKQVPFGTPDKDGRRMVRPHRNPTKPMGSTTLHNWFKDRLREAALADRKLHSMRHTAGQRILDATGDIKLVQKFLGHESIQTTADIYVDYDVEAVASRIADVLRGEDE